MIRMCFNSVITSLVIWVLTENPENPQHSGFTGTVKHAQSLQGNCRYFVEIANPKVSLQYTITIVREAYTVFCIIDMTWGHYLDHSFASTSKSLIHSPKLIRKTPCAKNYRMHFLQDLLIPAFYDCDTVTGVSVHSL